MVPSTDPFRTLKTSAHPVPSVLPPSHTVPTHYRFGRVTRLRPPPPRAFRCPYSLNCAFLVTPDSYSDTPCPPVEWTGPPTGPAPCSIDYLRLVPPPPYWIPPPFTHARFTFVQPARRHAGLNRSGNILRDAARAQHSKQTMLISLVWWAQAHAALHRL